MGVTYQGLLDCLKPHGIGQVSKMIRDGKTVVMLARKEESYFPYAYKIAHFIRLPDSSSDHRIHPEVVAATLRRFGINESTLQSSK